MRVWIDATMLTESDRIFGMTLLERHLRSILEALKSFALLDEAAEKLDGLVKPQPRLTRFLAREIRPSEIRIELAPDAPQPLIAEELADQLAIVFSRSQASVGERLQKALGDAGDEPVMALAADTVVDHRVIEQLLWRRGSLAFFGGEEDNGAGAALRLESTLSCDLSDARTLRSIASCALSEGELTPFPVEEFDGYIPNLRRDLPPYLFHLPDGDSDARERVERFLFHSNYKGATDFMTKHVYPPLVWRMVHPLAERGVKPNSVTAVGIAATFLAIPFFAAGWWIVGMTLAFGMSVLDSVDGKLARLTFTSSDQGNVLDHGTDLIHPPLWYCAWAWGLSGGDPYSVVFQISLTMLGVYVIDRLFEKLFKASTGRSIQDYRPLDVRLRTFSSRRNVNLVIFAVALPLGLGSESLFAILGLQVLTAAYHLVRLVQFWNVKSSGRKTLRESPLAAC